MGGNAEVGVGSGKGGRNMKTPEEKRATVADCLRRRKIRLKSIHICQDCGMRPPFEGKTLCVALFREPQEAGERPQSAQKST